MCDIIFLLLCDIIFFYRRERNDWGGGVIWKFLGLGLKVLDIMWVLLVIWLVYSKEVGKSFFASLLGYWNYVRSVFIVFVEIVFFVMGDFFMVSRWYYLIVKFWEMWLFNGFKKKEKLFCKYSVVFVREVEMGRIFFFE